MSSTATDPFDDPFQIAAPGRKREFFSFLKSIRSFKGDLSAFTAPPFLLSPISLTEHPAGWAEQPSLLVAPAAESDQTQRALLVLKWYLSSFMQQFGRRNDKRKKKPLNPFLGEIFLGRLDDEAVGATQIVTEQVSHHPPVTAYRMWNEASGVSLQGYHAQMTTFSGTVHMERIGHLLMHLDEFDEDYLVTLPKVHLEGLIPPPPHPEFHGSTEIVTSTGYTIHIDYSGRGWLRGKKNSLIAKMYKWEDPEKILYTADGQWNGGSFVIKDAESKVLYTVDTSRTRDIPVLQVAPIHEQDPLESRRAWYKVAQGIENGDMSTVHREKSKIEEEQRAMRKAEQIEDREWQMRYFSKAESWPKVQELLAKAGKEIENERTKGIWRWDEEKFEKTKTKSEVTSEA